MGMSTFDSNHITEILAGHGDWFTAKLLRLIAKADAENLAKLEQVYPQEVGAYKAWLLSKDGSGIDTN